MLSLASTSEEDDRLVIDINLPVESPQRLSMSTESRISPRKSLLTLKTPSKDGGSESDASLFSSNSSSAKKRGRLSLRSPGDVDKDDNVNTDARLNVSRRILNSQVGSPVRDPSLSNSRFLS